jgi:putative DNA methylase
MVHGTWPMRTEKSGGLRDQARNALASSIVLVCRPRPASAALATRKELLAALKRDLPEALRRLQHGSIAPVDLAQAAIGPGMAVFSRYSKVIEADGSRMSVRAALQIINQALDDVLTEQESEFDGDTRWALAWFEQHGMAEGPYGDAETLATAKDISIVALVRAGLLEAKRGKVRLLRRNELPANWNPAMDNRLTVWELTQHLICRLEEGGESSASELLKLVGSLGDTARDLAYRLYNLCERKGWAQEATAYNGLVTAWPELTRLAQQLHAPAQGKIF